MQGNNFDEAWECQYRVRLASEDKFTGACCLGLEVVQKLLLLDFVLWNMNLFTLKLVEQLDVVVRKKILFQL